MAPLNPEQEAAANDLFLYATNTGRMYESALKRMERIARAVPLVRPTTAREQWMAHASIAKQAYAAEFGTHSPTYRQAYHIAVLVAVAVRCADHYREEQAEITAREAGKP